MSDLETFIAVAEAGLGLRVEEGDYSGLVGVMGHLLAVKERQNNTDAMFEPLKQTIALLKVYEQELPDVVYKQLEVRTDVQSEHMLPVTYLCSVLPPGNLSFVLSVFLAFFNLLISASIYLQVLPEKWNNVKKQAMLVKQQVAPLQAIEVASLRRKCASFDVEQYTFREHFRKNGPFR